MTELPQHPEIQPAVVVPRRAARRVRGNPVRLNDVHAKLNPTQVADRVEPNGVADVVRAVRGARRQGRAISIAGGCHAMGGQQFGSGTVHIDMRRMKRILDLDPERGTVTVEAGIQWPDLIRGCHVRQRATGNRWGITQKQTGADRLSIGGAIAANIHGRGLSMQPFVQDLEALTLVDAHGRVVHCSREDNADLFALVVGGYGLFGIVVAARVRLSPRRKLERVAERRVVADLLPAFAARIRSGYLYGDFQFAIDPAAPGFLRDGVFSCYRPVADATPIPRGQLRLSKADWQKLLYLAHCDKSAAFDQFTDFYLRSSGQIYWSDTHQLSLYLDDYHEPLDRALGVSVPATEVITELYVPRRRLAAFMDDVRADFRANGVDLVYGTIRLIERDDESFLAWARHAFACVIFNLHTEHTPVDIERSKAAFRRLIDTAIRHAGSYFLTYHKFATRAQVQACYPQFVEFLRRKRRYDPQERFQSDWYRHYRALFRDAL